MKEEKVGLTLTNWILSIIGILVLLTFIVLPPVFRVFLKEEEVKEPEKPKVIVGELVCKKDNIKETNYTDSDALIIKYKNKNITSYIERIERVYLDPIFYQKEKITYGKYVSSFASVSGYKYNATPDDDTSTIMISAEYDLTTFKPTTVTLEEEENPTAITNHYLLLDTIDETNENLTSNGYTCEKNNEQEIEAE